MQGKESKKMVDAGVVSLSTSLWSFPVVLIEKKDGTTCFCVDYRALNQITHKDSYPLQPARPVGQDLVLIHVGFDNWLLANSSG